MGNGAEPQALDPHLVSGFTEHKILTSLFEGLATLDGTTLEPKPAAAESWTVSDDGKVYRFTIRENAKWSNGDPVTAHDYVYAWQRNLSPGLGSEYAYMLHCIWNAKVFNEGRLTDFGQVGARALDERTLEVTLENPTPYFPAMQIHFSFFPVHRANIERFGRIDERGTKWTQAGNMVSNGPFLLTKWWPNRIITVAKNPYYWDANAVRLKEINFYPIDNLQTEELTFRAGGLHVTDAVRKSRLPKFRATMPQYLRMHPFLGSYFYRFNCARAPFTDVRVRRAFAMSIDRELITKNLLHGAYEPTACFTPPNTAGYTCTASIPYDVAAAKRLLAEAGFPDGRGLPPVELLFNTSEEHKLIAEAVQQMWKKNLNASVTLVNQDWKVYLDALTNMDYYVARSSWIGDYYDPNSFLDCFLTGGGNNRTGFSDARYDELIGRAAKTPEQGERYRLFQEAERILLDQAPIAPIYLYRRVYLRVPELKGWDENLLGYVIYKNVYFETCGAK
ncbi:MAG: peptide ABC transporter substrate-binding protein [Candidatus Hydrogenedentes bacterium]|nr:peptide ABC transporter substrate-binding protein [Candidatus Hydrogenedentota bacterium]